MGSWRSSGYLEYGYFTVLGLLVLESVEESKGYLGTESIRDLLV